VPACWQPRAGCGPRLQAAAARDGTLSAAAAAAGLPPAQLNELDGSCDKAQADFARFKLTNDEISSRRKWIASTRRQVRRAPP
jgi:hypothetical protein